MRVRLLAALLATLTLTGYAPSHGRVQSLLLGLHLRTKGLHYRIVIRGPNPEFLAITDTGARTITIYQRPGESDALLRKVLAYEFAHAIDWTYLTNTDRKAWLRARHAPAWMTWWPPDLRPEDAYGSGDFADCFSLWATHSKAFWRSDLPPPSWAELNRLARFFHQRGH
jgi:hypothetical protein